MFGSPEEDGRGPIGHQEVRRIRGTPRLQTQDKDVLDFGCWNE